MCVQQSLICLTTNGPTDPIPPQHLEQKKSSLEERQKSFTAGSQDKVIRTLSVSEEDKLRLQIQEQSSQVTLSGDHVLSTRYELRMHVSFVWRMHIQCRL